MFIGHHSWLDTLIHAIKPCPMCYEKTKTWIRSNSFNTINSPHENTRYYSWVTVNGYTLDPYH